MTFLRETLAVMLTVVCATAHAQQTDAGPTTPPGSKPAARTLSIDEAVGVALANSKQLRIAEEAVLKARGRVNESKSAFLPTLSADATVTRLDEGSTITFPDASGNPQTVTIVKDLQKAIAINALIPVDILGQIGAAVSLNQFLEIAQRLDFNRVRNQVVLDVKAAYYDALRAKAYVGVVDQALANARERLRTAEAFLRQEAGTKFDVLRAETEVANATQNLISAKNRVELAVALLNNALNIDQNTPITTVETPEPVKPTEDFNKSLGEAYKQRPEVLQSDAQIKASEKGVVLAQRSVLPSLGVNWNFQYTPDGGGFDPKQTTWAAVARLTLPIFEGGLHRARTQQARADVATAKLTKQQVLDGIALEVRQAYLGLTEASERLEVTAAALKQAEEQYRLAKVRFDAGVTQTPGASPLLEISDAQTALSQAQNNHISAKYDAQSSRAKLERASGKYAFAPGQSPGTSLKKDDKR